MFIAEVGQTIRLDSGLAINDSSGMPLGGPTPWAPFKVSSRQIDDAIDFLASSAPPANGRRSAYLVHPESDGTAFAPGIDVSVEVLLPGEQTAPVRRNSTTVQIGIRGEGVVSVEGGKIPLARHDVCNVPSMKPHHFRNDSDEIWVRLAYSNAPLLTFLGAHYSETVDVAWVNTPATDGPIDMDEPAPIGRESAPDLLVSPTGARLRGYEYLVDIEPIPNRPLHWPYETISQELSQAPRDGKRTIMALYNPATERKQGATNSFFVTLSQMPAGITPRSEGPGHRHSSTAINYHFAGTGYSVVDGARIDWAPGDLLLSAPSWSEHSHYPSETGMSAYTVQDHPQHIGMESLIWQERLDGPILALGQEAGQTGFVAPRNWDDD